MQTSHAARGDGLRAPPPRPRFCGGSAAAGAAASLRLLAMLSRVAPTLRPLRPFLGLLRDPGISFLQVVQQQRGRRALFGRLDYGPRRAARASSGLSGPAGASPHRLPIPSTALPSAFSALLLSLASFFGRAASLGSPVPSPLERPHDLPRVAWPRVAVAVQPHRPSSRGVADSPERLYLSPEPRPTPSSRRRTPRAAPISGVGGCAVTRVRSYFVGPKWEISHPKVGCGRECHI